MRTLLVFVLAGAVVLATIGLVMMSGGDGASEAAPSKSAMPGDVAERGPSPASPDQLPPERRVPSLDPEVARDKAPSAIVEGANDRAKEPPQLRPIRLPGQPVRARVDSRADDEVARARDLFEEGKYKEAAAAAREVLAEFPLEQRAMGLSAALACQRGEQDAARKLSARLPDSAWTSVAAQCRRFGVRLPRTGRQMDRAAIPGGRGQGAGAGIRPSTSMTAREKR